MNIFKAVKLFAIIFLGSFGAVLAQDKKSDFKSLERKVNEFTFQNTDGVVKIEFCSPRVFRVRYSWDGKFAPSESYMVEKYQWDPIKLSSSNVKDQIIINSDSLRLVIGKSPFTIKVYNQAGKLINADALPAQKKGAEVSLTKKLQPEEHFFGFGERMDFLDRRGKKLHLNV